MDVDMDAAASTNASSSSAANNPMTDTPEQTISYIEGQKSQDFMSDTENSDEEPHVPAAVSSVPATSAGALASSANSSGIPLPTSSRSSSSNQYQYLQQQQLAQQAYAKQLQSLAHHSEPIGIHHNEDMDQTEDRTSAPRPIQTSSSQQVTPGSAQADPRSLAAAPAPVYSTTPGASRRPSHSVSFKQDPQHVKPQHQQQQPQHQFQTMSSSFGGQPPTSSPNVSSYFSTSATSRFVPNTNEPSSVSSSYKSVVPNSASYHTAYSPYTHGGSSFNQHNPPSFHDRSLSNASAYFNTSTSLTQTQWARHSSVSSNTSPSGMRPHKSPQSDPPFMSRSRIPSVSESPFASSSFTSAFPGASSSSQTASTGSSVNSKQPTIRTSLLTSKLAAAAAAGPNQNSGAASSASAAAGPIPSSITPGGSTSSFPYPNPRSATGSLRKQSPRAGSMPSTSPFSHGSSFGNSSNMATGAMSTSFGRHRNSLGRQSFMPHPSSTTTNLSMATASGTSTPHSEKSADGGGKGKSPQREAMDVDDDAATRRAAAQDDSRMATTPPPEPAQSQIVQAAPVVQPTPPIVAPRSLPEHLDIATFPVPDVIVMLTALLQKIIDANDTLHPHHYAQQQQPPSLDFTNNFTANVLAFHGRNIPAIGLQAYLTRILKYCPTTNEVFISLLVYFDRIAQRANAGDFSTQDPSSGVGAGHDGDKANRQLFVMDSYNIHRLIIAGVTVASKFFSDVFYKNSRYAKVGGLPVEELNHLELQFLLLTDFKLMIPLEELQRYADLLLGFWKKEQNGPGSGPGPGGAGAGPSQPHSHPQAPPQ